MAGNGSTEPSKVSVSVRKKRCSVHEGSFFIVISVQPGSWLIPEEMMSYCVLNVDLCSGHVHAQHQPWPGKVHFTELMNNLHPSKQSPFVHKLNGQGLNKYEKGGWGKRCLTAIQWIVLYCISHF